jgi:hypothetical protein
MLYVTLFFMFYAVFSEPSGGKRFVLFQALHAVCRVHCYHETSLPQY